MKEANEREKPRQKSRRESKRNRERRENMETKGLQQRESKNVVVESNFSN